MNVLCDLDGICADLLPAWLGLYNNRYGDSVTVADITDWDVARCVKHPRKIYGVLDRPNVYRELKPVPGAVDGLWRICNAGHHVVIATATPRRVEVATEKLQWIKEHLPFIDHENIVIVHRKDLLRGDVLIDDAPRNILRHRAAWGDSCKLVSIAYPYNREEAAHCDLYADGWDKPKAAWEKITNYILDIGKGNK